MVIALLIEEESFTMFSSFKFLCVLEAGEDNTVVVVAVVMANMLLRPGVMAVVVLSI